YASLISLKRIREIITKHVCKSVATDLPLYMSTFTIKSLGFTLNKSHLLLYHSSITSHGLL
ncbi:MAG: hypothetical protein NZO16_08125, partial [Deltaproteobacteria bacterium]|nr:hypothetical protein [Deltaproteobacteria bacterium]